MKYFRTIYSFLLIVFLFLPISPVFSQIPDFSKVPNKDEGDSVLITNLIADRISISKERVICWFPKDSLSDERMKEIADTLNIGVQAVERLIGAPLEWQKHSFSEPYVFYFPNGRFISHASEAGFSTIPFWRIKAGKAPWLHEVSHEILATNTGSWFGPKMTPEHYKNDNPDWLFEGLADYVSLEASKLAHLPWFDVFSDSFITNEDSLFLKVLRSDIGPQIIRFMGKTDTMPEIESKEFKKYAPGFYYGSSSFVRYIARQYGLHVLLNAVSSFEKEKVTTEKLTNKSLEALMKEWLVKLNFK